MHNLQHESYIVYQNYLHELKKQIKIVHNNIENEYLEKQFMQLFTDFLNKEKENEYADIVNLIVFIKFLIVTQKSKSHTFNLDANMCIEIIETALATLNAKAIYDSPVLINLLTEFEYE